jgi:hypothetical protein
LNRQGKSEPSHEEKEATMLKLQLIFKRGTKISEKLYLSRDLEVNLKMTKEQVTIWWEEGLVASYGEGIMDTIEGFFELVEGDYKFLKDKKDSELGGNMPRIRSTIMSSVRQKKG